MGGGGGGGIVEDDDNSHDKQRRKLADLRSRHYTRLHPFRNRNVSIKSTRRKHQQDRKQSMIKATPERERE